MQLASRLLLLLPLATSFKYLVFNPQFASSHTNFIAKITDLLVDAGHEVVMLSPKHDTNVGGPRTKKARVIELPQSETSKAIEKYMQGEGGVDIWGSNTKIGHFFNYDIMKDLWVVLCEETLLYPGLLEQLRAENFDAAYSESIDLCPAGLFHLLNISTFAVTDSLAIVDAHFHVTQMAGNPSYVPTGINGENGDEMSFVGRVANSLTYFGMIILNHIDHTRYQKMFDRNWNNFPDIMELASQASLVFSNSEPLIDFPRPTSSRFIDIGGISTHESYKPLNETWGALLDRRKHNVFISFGTYLQSHIMPREYKETIKEVARRMPEVTFIWKYERPSHKISEGIDNLVEVTWIPQYDLLNDPRLSLFVTHCGQGSIAEAYTAGIPQLAITLMGDQLRNGQHVKRNGVGILMQKWELEDADKLEKAMRDIVYDDKYRKRAKAVKKMIERRPFSMKEIFIRNMEFMTEHGPLRQLDHHGRRLNFIQYYLIDVIAFFAFIILSALFIVFCSVRFIVRRSCKLISSLISRPSDKKKKA